MIITRSATVTDASRWSTTGSARERRCDPLSPSHQRELSLSPSGEDPAQNYPETLNAINLRVTNVGDHVTRYETRLVARRPAQHLDDEHTLVGTEVCAQLGIQVVELSAAHEVPAHDVGCDRPDRLR